MLSLIRRSTRTVVLKRLKLQELTQNCATDRNLYRFHTTKNPPHPLPPKSAFPRTFIQLWRVRIIYRCEPSNPGLFVNPLKRTRRNVLGDMSVSPSGDRSDPRKDFSQPAVAAVRRIFCCIKSQSIKQDVYKWFAQNPALSIPTFLCCSFFSWAHSFSKTTLPSQATLTEEGIDHFRNNTKLTHVFSRLDVRYPMTIS